MFNQVPVEIKLAFDIVVSGRGKPCGKSAKKDGQGVSSGEIRCVDSVDVHGGSVLSTLRLAQGTVKQHDGGQLMRDDSPYGKKIDGGEGERV